MIPGALAAMAACLLSGREDWRGRVAYFAMFGALGWGFGASISYMQVLSYTHSGNALTQAYGFLGLFVIGFLWGGMGGAGTALPAVATRERLTELFRPLCWILVFWTVLKYAEFPTALWYRTYVWEEDPMQPHGLFGWLEWFRARVWGDDPIAFDKSGHRQESPFYWFDADWLQATFAVLAILAFDLWDRRKSPEYVALVIPFGIIGAIAGHVIYDILQRNGTTAWIAEHIISYQGDTTRFNSENLLTNWPQFLWDMPNAIGALVGLIIALTIYFAIFGKFRSGSSLFLHMALGWLIAFIAMPVLLTNWFMDYGGFRMTPPRGDDWAGITGVLLGTWLYVFRKGLAPVGYASIITAFVGGLGFAGIACLKLIMVWPGNPNHLNPTGLSPSPTAGIETVWAHWQGANWHSFLEQSYGFVNGISIALAIGLLATRMGRVNNAVDPDRPRRWTQVFAVAFILVLLSYLNMFKNVAEWTGGAHQLVPLSMKAPLFQRINLSAVIWFNLTYALIAIVVIGVLIRHLKRPIALVPASWLGRGQLLYIGFLVLMVMANFERALNGFTEQRLLTEWVIIVNALIAICLILTLPREGDYCDIMDQRPWGPRIARAIGVGIVGSAILLTGYWGIVRGLYGDAYAGHAGKQYRFGPEAVWKVQPNLKKGEHS